MKPLKVALVHDYLNEFGGAERVLESLAELFPDAPLYTAFYQRGSAAHERFKNRKIITSFAQHIPGFPGSLHSPLRFMAPLIWESFNFDGYDVVISSASWYITKGILTRPETLHISYIHTPPRYLYGFETARTYTRFWPVRIYAAFVNKHLREYDFVAAQRPDVLVANSREVQGRISKFYRRESVIIHPPVTLPQVGEYGNQRGYFLTGGRLVAPKHFDLVIEAANQLRLPLVVFGEGPERYALQARATEGVRFVGKVPDEELVKLYRGAWAFVALAEDEDFGITPVEAMAQGTPVVAFNGGGFRETVIPNQTGLLVNTLTVTDIVQAMRQIKDTPTLFSEEALRTHAETFSKTNFQRAITALVDKHVGH